MDPSLRRPVRRKGCLVSGMLLLAAIGCERPSRGHVSFSGAAGADLPLYGHQVVVVKGGFLGLSHSNTCRIHLDSTEDDGEPEFFVALEFDRSTVLSDPKVQLKRMTHRIDGGQYACEVRGDRTVSEIKGIDQDRLVGSARFSARYPCSADGGGPVACPEGSTLASIEGEVTFDVSVDKDCELQPAP